MWDAATRIAGVVAALLGAVVSTCSESDEQGTLRGPPLTPTAQAWVTSMRTSLPPMLCDHAFFQECFDVADDECRRVARQHFDACANEHRTEIPDVPTPVSGSEAGRVIGRCVGRRLELALKERRLFLDTERCKNPDAW
jgi:hypothetical protein